MLPAFPALATGPAEFSVLKKLPLEAWGLQHIKVMQKKLFKTKPGVINLKVYSKQMIKVTKSSYLGLKKTTYQLPSRFDTGLCQKASVSVSLVFLENSPITNHLHN